MNTTNQEEQNNVWKHTTPLPKLYPSHFHVCLLSALNHNSTMHELLVFALFYTLTISILFLSELFEKAITNVIIYS